MLNINDLNHLIELVDLDILYCEQFMLDKTEYVKELKDKLVRLHYSSKMKIYGYSLPVDFEETCYDYSDEEYNSESD